MAAKGSILKQEVSEKILATFPNSFLYNDGKEIRINGTENGEQLQIKVVLTCAKVAVGGGDEIPVTGDAEPVSTISATPTAQTPQEPTDEEKERLATLLSRLGL